MWCVSSIVLGLLLALVLDASPSTAMLGWVVAGLGLAGLVLTILMPAQGGRRSR